SQERALMLSAILGIVLSVAIVMGDNNSSSFASLLQPFGFPALPNTVFFLALLGLANAIVWPAIWPMALRGLGAMTSTASALLIMAIAGGAILPVVLGGLAMIEGVGRQGAYGVLIPAYAFIFFYAVKGHKIKTWR